MKLREKEFTPQKRRSNVKKWLRKVIFNYNKTKKKKKSLRGKAKKHTDYYKIIAPTILDLYKPQNHKPMVEFVTEIEKRATKGTKKKSSWNTYLF